MQLLADPAGPRFAHQRQHGQDGRLVDGDAERFQDRIIKIGDHPVQHPDPIGDTFDSVNGWQ